MPDLPYRSSTKKTSEHEQGEAHQPSPRKDPKEVANEEALREQSRTEIEERPYLDTEGSD